MNLTLIKCARSLQRTSLVFCLALSWQWAAGQLVLGQESSSFDTAEVPEFASLDHTSSTSGTSEPPVRYAPWGNGHIVITDPAEDPFLPIFLTDRADSLFALERPNMLNIPVEDEWDFYNLINTDRPDFTDATYSVGKGVTIIESGYTFRRSNSSAFQTSRKTLPEVLCRLGITDELELRVRWNGYVMTQEHDLNSNLTTREFGADDLNLGIKYEIWQQQMFLPMLTVVTGSTIPSGSKAAGAGQMQPYLNLVGGWGIRRWLYLKVSTGVDFLHNNNFASIIPGNPQIGPTLLTSVDNTTTWHQSASLLFQISKRVGGFAEWYAFFQGNGVDNRPAHFVDTGFYYYITPNLQLDGRVGTQLSQTQETFFTGAGFSVRY